MRDKSLRRARDTPPDTPPSRHTHTIPARTCPAPHFERRREIWRALLEPNQHISRELSCAELVR